MKTAVVLAIAVILMAVAMLGEITINIFWRIFIRLLPFLLLGLVAHYLMDYLGLAR